MPIYEYICPSCNTTFEELVKNATDASSDYCACPHCKAEAQRMMSPTTFILKGGGWYVTEYGGKSTDSEKNTLNPETTSATDNNDKAASSKDTAKNAEKTNTSSSSTEGESMNGTSNSSDANNVSKKNNAEAKKTTSAQASSTNPAVSSTKTPKNVSVKTAGASL